MLVKAASICIMVIYISICTVYSHTVHSDLEYNVGNFYLRFSIKKCWATAMNSFLQILLNIVESFINFLNAKELRAEKKLAKLKFIRYFKNFVYINCLLLLFFQWCRNVNENHEYIPNI